ncbi:MAG: phycocyanin subunit beta, partial [Cyanobacteria bacterium P01_D01_bin.116]
MLDAFAKVVSQADSRGEFLSSEQLDALSNMIKDKNSRLDTVNRITSNASQIVTDAARALFEEQPQ